MRMIKLKDLLTEAPKKAPAAVRAKQEKLFKLDNELDYLQKMADAGHADEKERKRLKQVEKEMDKLEREVKAAGGNINYYEIPSAWGMK